MSLYLKRAIVILIIMLLVVSYLTVKLYKSEKRLTFSGEKAPIVIIDAGHGLPDGGAVGSKEVPEAEINLKISKKLSAKLNEKCYNVIMTRTTEEGIYKDGQTIKEKKRSDMYEREKIMNGSGGDIFVSIHMNKFQEEKYRGAQVFYSGNTEESALLAEFIQKRLHELDPTNERAIKEAESSIYLMKKAKIPAVIVECGFLSNKEEEEKLLTEKYKNEIAASVALGIEDYFERKEGQN